MLKTLSVAALVAAMSFATVPAMVSVAQAQGANEPPTAPAPDDAKDAAGAKGDMSKDTMSKGSMSKGSMSKGSMSKSGGMKKMSKKHSKKMKHM